MVDSDRITGKAKETFGKAQGAVGDVFGDDETRAKGAYNQAAGTAENLYGQAKDTVKDALGDSFSDVGQSAENALHSLEREVKARPLIALLIAALVGYVLAQLTSN